MPPNASPTAWIDAYGTWAAKRSPLTPPHFHENIAYSLASCAIAGRVCVETPQGRVYPNLYTLLLGKTTVYAKSIAMDLSQTVAELARIDDRIINSVFTPESIMGELSGEKPSNLDTLSDDLQSRWRQAHGWGPCRMFRLDEAGIFFNTLKREYNMGLSDLWMKLYDCPSTVERLTNKHGLHVIPRPVLSCMFSTTPMSIGPLLRDQMYWQSGFWPRWNFCVGGGYPEMVHAEAVVPGEAVIKPLFDTGNNKLGSLTAEDPLIVPYDDEVYADYEAVLEANRKRIFQNPEGYVESALGRLHTKRLKLALILAVINTDDRKQMRVTMDLWRATAKPVKQMELDMAEGLRQAERTHEIIMEQRIKTFLLAQPDKEADIRDLQRHLNNMEIAKLRDSYLRPMEQLGILSIIGGRPARVKLVGDGEGGAISL